MIDIQAAAKKIGVKIKEWPGNCYAIASKFVAFNIVTGRAVYGHYYGRVEPGTMFSTRGLPFIRHGWIVKPDGGIVDPTRWVFESAKPYVYEGPADATVYDAGGRELREALFVKPGCPKYSIEYPAVRFPSDPELTALIQSRLPDDQPLNALRANQLDWIANLPPEHFGDLAKPFYQWLKDGGRQALIPIDFRTEVFADGP